MSPLAAVAQAATTSAVQDGFEVAHDGATAVIDLAGTWDFTPVQPAASPTTIQVPGGGWYKQGFTSTTEATYSRSITIPASAAGQSVILDFGAVNHEATVKIGSTTVGTTTTSYTPTSFDLTPYVSAGQTYPLSVTVKGRGALKAANGKYTVAQGADWAEAVPQGIYRSAALRIYPKTYLESTFVKTSVADRTVTFDAVLRNTSASAQTVTLTSDLSSATGANFPYPADETRTVTVPAGSSVTTTVGPLPWTAGTDSYWWPNVPYKANYRAQLHLLALTLSGQDISQTATTRFGFREFTQPANQTQYFLNGIAVNLRGDNIQGANYDRIDNGGKGDAFDTLPGFLPPSPTNAGWPKAVDNYQRLNYNVVRLHQEIPSPYMIDVLDEMGMMAIGESAIRGSARAEDYVAGRDNMVKHVRDLVLRDRNHASIVQWSQSNEADWEPSNSEQFQKDLFTAMRTADPTRPIMAEVNITPHTPGGNVYPSMTPENGFSQFNLVGHYLDGFNNYGTAVRDSTTRPNGEGEYIWPGGSLKQGFTWFSTSTVGKRGKGAADLRPYTLLSAWAGFVPGTKTTDFITEENRPPIYGEDNLPDPWSNPQIQLLQTGFSPYLTADLAYWDANGRSDANGAYPSPSTVETLPRLTSTTRTVTVFNDSLSSAPLTFAWKVRRNTADGAVLASGESRLNITPGSKATAPVTFTTPSAGSRVFLELTTSQNGAVVFQDARQYFELQGPELVVDNSSSSIQYSNGWLQSAVEPGLYQGTNTYSETAGATATLPFTGTSVSLNAVKAASHGIAAISIDGGPEVLVDLYAPARAGDSPVWSSPTLANGAHTLRVRVTGTKSSASSRSWVAIDRFIVRTDLAPTSPRSVSAAALDGSRVEVTWQEPESSGTSDITQYIVYDVTGAATEVARVAGTARAATISDLVPGTTHTYAVRAVNAAGSGELSAASPSVQLPTDSAVKVTSVAATRCVAGKVVLIVRATNTGTASSALAISTPYGSKSAVSTAPGKTISAAFSTRLTSIQGGSVTVIATAGQSRAETKAAYEGATCP